MQVLNDLLSVQTKLERMRLVITKAAFKVQEAITEVQSLDMESVALTLPVDSLTEREMEILKLLATSKIQEISEKLNLSPKTIRNHRENIRQKLKLEAAIDVNRAAKKQFG